MTAWTALYAQQPGWAWLGVAAAILAAELATGSGHLLWPSAAAGITALLAFAGLGGGPLGQILEFAALTVATTYAARRWWPADRRAADGADLNDWRGRLVGREGEAVAGGGRVFVDGKEWAAEWEDAGAGPAAEGSRIRVTAVVDGGRLRVRPI